MARRASVTKPLSVIMSVIMAPTRSSRKVRAERFGTAWARRVSQAQRGIGIGVSMGRHRRRSKTLQLRALPTRCARFAGSAVTLKGQQATKNLTPEGADQATETLNSSFPNRQPSFSRACEVGLHTHSLSPAARTRALLGRVKALSASGSLNPTGE